MRKASPAVPESGIDDLLLPEGKSQKFVEDLERETARSAREMDRTFHVRQAMDELAIAKDVSRRIRDEAPMSDRRDARELYAPSGGADTLVDAPKVVLRSFGRDAPTLITRRRSHRRHKSRALGIALLSIAALVAIAVIALRPRRVGILTHLPMPDGAVVSLPRAPAHVVEVERPSEVPSSSAPERPIEPSGRPPVPNVSTHARDPVND